MVSRLVAEQITQHVIRMFPPRSAFPVLKPEIGSNHYIPDELPPANDGTGCYFEPPQGDQWQLEHRQARQSLTIRACGLMRALLARNKATLQT